MRELLVLAWLLALPVGAFAQTGVWQKYTVPETGATVDLPAAVFAKDAGRPETGYGRRFTTADGRATLAVQSMTNEAKDTPASFLAKKHPPSNIAYSRITPRFFVISSFRKNLIWYDRCNFAGRFVNCVMLNYPAAEKRQWDGVISRISNTLAGGY